MYVQARSLVDIWQRKAPTMNYSTSLVGHLASPSTAKGADPAPEISSKRTEENRKEPVTVE
jgi:hypothetical protein